MRAKLSIALSALAAMVWAAPSAGAAHLFSRAVVRPFAIAAHSVVSLPMPARFRLQKESGLLLRVWLNGNGPYIFAIDTGAGLNVITERIAGELRLPVRFGRHTILAGLTAARISSNREAVINQMALGERSNTLPSQKTAVIVTSLAPGIDGILDPTAAYSPYGYSIDITNERMEAIGTNATNATNDTNGTNATSVARSRIPQRPGKGIEGAVVPWLRVGEGNRPFVRLGDGRIALIDTGSGFGLAVSERNAIIIGGTRGREKAEGVRDIGGGTIFSRRVSPSTVSIGDLVLRGIPTDILSQVDTDAPVILGRDALYPFKISFDPRRRLIEFVTSAVNN